MKFLKTFVAMFFVVGLTILAMEGTFYSGSIFFFILFPCIPVTFLVLVISEQGEKIGALEKRIRVLEGLPPEEEPQEMPADPFGVKAEAETEETGPEQEG